MVWHLTGQAAKTFILKRPPVSQTYDSFCRSCHEIPQLKHYFKVITVFLTVWAIFLQIALRWIINRMPYEASFTDFYFGLASASTRQNYILLAELPCVEESPNKKITGTLLITCLIRVESLNSSSSYEVNCGVWSNLVGHRNGHPGAAWEWSNPCFSGWVSNFSLFCVK